MAQVSVRWIEVAVIGRPHGLRGEVHVHLHNPQSGILTAGRSVGIGDGNSQQPGIGPSPIEGRKEGEPGPWQEHVIERSQQTSRDWIVKMVGVDQLEAAAALTNKRLFVRRNDLPRLDPGEYYQADLVGLTIRDSTGCVLGTILGFFNNGAHEICVIRTGAGEEVLIPFTEENLVDIDEAAGLVVVELPEGLPGLGHADG